MNRKSFEEAGKREFLRFTWVLLGVTIYALGYRLFIAPAGLYSGGFVGISQIIRNLLHDAGFMKDVDFTGIIYWILNIPIFLIALKAVGRRFVLRTALAISALVTYVFERPIARLGGPRKAGSAARKHK